MAPKRLTSSLRSMFPQIRRPWANRAKSRNKIPQIQDLPGRCEALETVKIFPENCQTPISDTKKNWKLRRIHNFEIKKANFAKLKNPKKAFDVIIGFLSTLLQISNLSSENFSQGSPWGRGSSRLDVKRWLAGWLGVGCRLDPWRARSIQSAARPDPAGTQKTGKTPKSNWVG